MLAKIAHALAVVEDGIDGFAPMLPHFILGNLPVPADHFVGCLERDLPAESMLHRATLEIATLGENQPQFLVANIRLFAKFGAPQYHVVVGIPSDKSIAAHKRFLASSSVSTQVRKYNLLGSGSSSQSSISGSGPG